MSASASMVCTISHLQCTLKYEWVYVLAFWSVSFKPAAHPIHLYECAGCTVYTFKHSLISVNYSHLHSVQCTDVSSSYHVMYAHPCTWINVPWCTVQPTRWVLCEQISVRPMSLPSFHLGDCILCNMSVEPVVQCRLPTCARTFGPLLSTSSISWSWSHL